MSIVDALKKLIVAVGSAQDVNEVPGANVAEVINVFAENPPVSGGNPVLRIKVTDGAEAGTYVSDVAFADIVDAIENDETLICDIDATLAIGPNSAPVNLTFSSYSRVYDGEDLQTVVFIGDSFTTIGGTTIAFMVTVLLGDEDDVVITLLQLSVAE